MPVNHLKASLVTPFFNSLLDICTNQTQPDNPAVPASKSLSDPARRALVEAEERRAVIDAKVAAMPAEKSGRGGLDPVRYGDWEIKGLTADF